MRPIEMPRLCLRTRRFSDAGEMLAHWPDSLVGSAARQVLTAAFCETGRALITCGQYEGNRSPRRMIRKCGFPYAFSAGAVGNLLDGKKAVWHVFCLPPEAYPAQKRAVEDNAGGLLC